MDNHPAWPYGGSDPRNPQSLPTQLTFKLGVLPHAMEDLGAHVQVKLNGLLMKYHEEAGGVLLALSDLGLPKARPFATVMGDLPFLHLHVEATALVFAPRPGLALEGRVTKVGGWVACGLCVCLSSSIIHGGRPREMCILPLI